MIQLYKLLDKNIKGFAKIYHIGYIKPPKKFISRDGKLLQVKGESKVVKSFDEYRMLSSQITLYNGTAGYVIMEKVDTSEVIHEIRSLRDLLEKFVFNKRDVRDIPQELKTRSETSLTSKFEIFPTLYEWVKDGLPFMDYLEDKLGNIPEILYELISVFKSISEVYPGWDDIHSGQFGRNKKGELVVFDVGDDDNKYGGDLSEYPNPKNIIKESKDHTHLYKDLPKDLKKAYMKNLIGDQYFNDKVDEYMELYKEGKIDDTYSYYLEKRLIDVSYINFRNSINIDYLIKTYFQDGYDTEIYYHIYDPNRKDFVSPDEIQSIQIEEMDDDGFSDTLEVNYPTLNVYSIEDAIKYRQKTFGAMKKMNESEERHNIPKDVKKAFYKFISEDEVIYNNNLSYYNGEMDDEDDLFRTNVYLLDFRNDDMIDENFVIKVYMTDPVDHSRVIYRYDENKKEFVFDNEDDLYDEDGDGLDGIEREYPVLLEYTYNDWLKSQESTNRLFKSMNESNSYGQLVKESVPKNVKRAFIKYIGNCKEFQKYALDEYKWREEKGIYDNPDNVAEREMFFHVEIFLYDINRDENFLGYPYLIETHIWDDGDEYREVYVYDENTETFVDASMIEYDNSKNTLYGYVDNMIDRGEDLSDTYEVVGGYDYNDWVKNQQSVSKAMVKINESKDRDIFGEYHEPPKSIKEVPKKVRDEYFKACQEIYEGEYKWRKSNGYLETDIDKSQIYLIYSKNIFIIKDEGAEDYDYLIKHTFYNPYYNKWSIYIYVYSEKRGKFIDASDVEYTTENVPHYKRVLASQYISHDNYRDLEKQNGYITYFTYIQWRIHKKQMSDYYKSVNESDSYKVGIKNVPKDVRNAFYNFIQTNDTWKSQLEHHYETNIRNGRFEDFVAQIYLFDITDNEIVQNTEAFGFKDNMVKYLLVMVFDYNDINIQGPVDYYVYYDKEKSFVDLYDFDYLDSILDEAIEIYMTDEYDNYELIELYDQDDWIKDKNKMIKRFKDINRQ